VCSYLGFSFFLWFCFRIATLAGTFAATSVAGGELELSFRVIALLAVFGQVQTRGFNFLAWAQTDTAFTM